MKCTACGADIAQGRKFCSQCGAPAPAESGGTRCPACGAPIQPGAKFCPTCGAASAARCPSCGAELKPGARFCSGCGGAAGTGQPVPVVPRQPAFSPPSYPAAPAPQYYQQAYPPPAGPVPPPPQYRPYVQPKQGGGGGCCCWGALIFLLLVVLLIGAAGYFAWQQPLVQELLQHVPIPPEVQRLLQPSTPKVLDLGVSQVKDPEPAKVQRTREFGVAPVNQVLVLLKDGQTKADGERVAQAIGGSVVGQIEFINLFQIETKGANEAELKASIEKAKGVPGVSAAGSNSGAGLSDIKGKSCSPLNDPFYDGDNGRPYDIIGVEGAWDVIRASGLPLNSVQVGVVDQALSSFSDETGGKSRISGLDAGDSTNAKDPDPRMGGFTHATLVSQVVAANSDNGGTVGIASILGDKLTVKVAKTLGGAGPEFTAAKPDPKNLAQVQIGGVTYVSKSLSSIVRQIEKNSTIINCSFNYTLPGNNQFAAEAFRQFMQKLAQKYPKVLIVGSAGNYNQSLDGSNDIFGQKHPNVITVGALDNNGRRAAFVTAPGMGSNIATGNGEVTLSAPGMGIVAGNGPDGKPVMIEGTSFAAPMVAAAAALIRSVNPDLTAEEIKKLLVDTARPGVTGDKQSVPIPAGMGKGVLRVDEAVLKVVNDMRAKQKPPLPALTLDQAKKLGSIEAVATPKKPQEYDIKGTVAATNKGGTDVTISTSGQGILTGNSKQHVDGAGEAKWSWTFKDNKETGGMKVTRTDNGACSIISLTQGQLGGKWSGTSTMTSFDMPGMENVPGIVKEQITKGMGVGQSFPFEFTIVEETPESGSMSIASSGQTWKLSYTFRDNVLTARYSGTQSDIVMMSDMQARLSQSGGNVVLEGNWSGSAVQASAGPSGSIKVKGNWKATKAP